jgi:hypothetical protein
MTGVVIPTGRRFLRGVRAGARSSKYKPGLVSPWGRPG